MKALMTAAAILGLAVSPAAANDEKAEPTKGEAKLAKLLEGRVAGEPRDCITTYDHGNLHVIDKTALVYERGDTVWVNRTRHPESLDDDDYLVIVKYGSGSQLCRLDNITTRDRTSNFFSGVVFLTDFVPYKKVDEKG